MLGQTGQNWVKLTSNWVESGVKLDQNWVKLESDWVQSKVNLGHSGVKLGQIDVRLAKDLTNL